MARAVLEDQVIDRIRSCDAARSLCLGVTFRWTSRASITKMRAARLGAENPQMGNHVRWRCANHGIARVAQDPNAVHAPSATGSRPHDERGRDRRALPARPRRTRRCSFAIPQLIHQRELRPCGRSRKEAPLRTRPGLLGSAESACRSRSEMIWPAVRPRLAASCFARAKTSASRSTVVRMFNRNA
jgi:hypothetical protein